MNSKNNTLRSIITLIVLVGATIVANVLGFQANTDTGNIANQIFNDSNFFFPATYVFTTIWPVIYAGIIGLAVYQALPAQRDNPRFRAAAPWLMVNLVLNALWVWVFGMQAFISTLPIMAALIVTGVIAYRKLGIQTAQVGLIERILQITFSIYLAWLSVATVANVASALIAAGWNGFGLSYQAWALIMLLVGIGLSLFLYRGLGNNVVFPLVYVYAYVGILFRHGDEPLVVAGAAIGAVVLAAFSIYHFYTRNRRANALRPA
jgi:hypothetical protein